MPQPPRLLFPKTAVFITTRTEEGLPLIPAAFMNRILESILARAQSLYPVIIAGYKFMNNHLHMLLVVESPDDVVGFMSRIKTESGHAVNHLLGRRRHTVWQEGYDSPPVLTPDDVVSKLIYLYTNAQNANLVSTIDEYPNVNSWKMFTSGVCQKVCKWIQRPMIPKLSKTNLTISEQNEFTENILAKAKKEHILTLNPDAWLSCFKITDPEQIEEYRKKVIDGVREAEKQLIEKRAAENKTVVGVKKLLTQPIDIPYTPKKFGRRMWCICRDRKLRIQFIQQVKILLTEARQVLEKWKLGDTEAKYPLGLFPPSMPRQANLLYFEYSS